MSQSSVSNTAVPCAAGAPQNKNKQCSVPLWVIRHSQHWLRRHQENLVTSTAERACLSACKYVSSLLILLAEQVGTISQEKRWANVRGVVKERVKRARAAFRYQTRLTPLLQHYFKTFSKEHVRCSLMRNCNNTTQFQPLCGLGVL